MAQAQFEAYLDTAVQEYAQGHLQAGDCAPQDALALAQKDYRELLPDGLASKNQFLFCALDDAPGGNVVVGMVWFAVKEGRTRRTAFIYDIKVGEDFRGQGYGRQLMQQVEDLVLGMGIARLSLHVFGHNHVARALYEKIGYQITGIGMTKALGTG